MTRGFGKGLIVAALHVAIVASLGGKLLLDRATRPRVWARVAPYDPALPIRGRYLSLQVEGTFQNAPSPGSAVILAVVDQQLVFERSQEATGLSTHWRRTADGHMVATLDQPIAFFISEHRIDPSVRPPGEELWAEVTIPKKGGPRPLRLAVKKNGVLTPLD